MSATDCTLRVCRQGQAVTFQVAGHARIPQALVLRKAGEQAIADGAAALQIDLHDCGYMDSTFIGTLLFLRGRSDRPVNHAVILMAPSPHCRQTLHQMGLDTIFAIHATEPGLPQECWTELPCGSDITDACKHRIFEAHRELAGLGGPVGTKFRDVVSCLGPNAAEHKR